MLYCPPALLRSSILRSFSEGRLFETLSIRKLTLSHQKISLRPFTKTSPTMMDSNSSSRPASYQASEDMIRIGWPEESLTSTADEGGGFYPARIGETFDDGRFVITRKLGWGGFSNVWLARDRKDDRHVAIKMLSAHASREIEAGRLGERDILRKITTESPSHHGFLHVIRLLHEFTFESFAGKHFCFVTDVLSNSLRSLQNETCDARLPLKLILRATKHVLNGLEYLHDECKVVHSDLKPANVLLLPSGIDTIVMHKFAEQPTALYEFQKTIPPDELPIDPVPSNPLLFDLGAIQDVNWNWVIADLGHAHLQNKHLSGTVQPHALRAPEVILGLEWGPAIDIWSLGCMVLIFLPAYCPQDVLADNLPKMYEFATGRWLFTPGAIDDIPRDIVHLAQMTLRTDQVHDESALKQFEIREKHADLQDMLRRATAAYAGLESIESESKINSLSVYGKSAEEVAGFVGLMNSFLTLDPTKRPRAVEALRDPIFGHV